MTYKLVYFILWSKVLDIIQTGDHLNNDGFLQIMAIKAAFKEGLNSNLSDLYPEIKPLISPSYSPSLNLINEEWLSGFLNTDGSFSLNKYKTSKKDLNFNVIPQIRIYQDDKSLVVLEAIQKYLETGRIIKPSSGRNVSTLAFTSKISILPLIRILNKCPLKGIKRLDFLDFCEGYDLYLKKEHLNSSG